MSVAKKVKAGALAFSGALIALGVITVTGNLPQSLAGSPKPNFSLAVTPSSAPVERGQVATYQVTLSDSGRFNSAVALSVSNLPAGATATFSPNSLDKSGDAASLAITTSSSTPVGSKTVAITGTSSSLVHHYNVSLKVTADPTPKSSLSASPASNTMRAGNTATYAVTVTRTTGFTGAVVLAVSAGLPSDTTATFSPRKVTGATSTLRVATQRTTSTGNYTITITATNARTPQQSTSVGLTLTAPDTAFTISGPSFTGLAPGLTRRLNLSLTNPNHQALSVTNLTVAIQTVTTVPSASGPCTPADYAVTQFTGAYPLTAPASGRVKLSDLGIPGNQWPTLSMLNSTTQNQDGCKGATVTLAFSGAGQG